MTTPSYDATPPISAPLRFFLTAPVFGLLLGVLLLSIDPDALLSRWSWPVLAGTHVLTLGMLAPVMVGALIQMLPVVAGVSLHRPLLLAGWSHLWLTLGAILLASGFWWQQPPLLRVGGSMLLLALLPFALLALHGLWGRSSTDSTSRLMVLALLALTAAVGLGASLLGHVAWGLPLNAQQLTHLHVLWGGLGWVLGLVMGVAYAVVPMFQTTPRYPSLLEQRGLYALLAVLLLASLLLLLPDWRWLAALLAALPAAAFAVLTLKLLRQSRRGGDISTSFWRLSMACLLLSALVAAAVALGVPGLELLAGALFLYGFAGSLTCGMLYKIVPFLVWLHLQRLSQRRFAIPNMKQIISEDWIRRQWQWHLASVPMLALALGWQQRPLLVLAALLLMASQSLLARNLWYAVRRYRSAVAAMAGAPA